MINLPPLHILIQGEALSVIDYTVSSPISNLHGRDYCELFIELKNDQNNEIKCFYNIPFKNYKKAYRHGKVEWRTFYS